MGTTVEMNQKMPRRMELEASTLNSPCAKLERTPNSPFSVRESRAPGPAREFDTRAEDTKRPSNITGSAEPKHTRMDVTFSRLYHRASVGFAV